MQGGGGGEALCNEKFCHCFFLANISYFAFKEPLSKDHDCTADRCRNPTTAPPLVTADPDNDA